MEMHDYLVYAVSGVSSLSEGKRPTLTITGNNRRAVLRSAERTMKLGGYWHRSPMKNKKSINGWPTITVDRIERRKG
jgi:hypothetical protein